MYRQPCAEEWQMMIRIDSMLIYAPLRNEHECCRVSLVPLCCSHAGLVHKQERCPRLLRSAVPGLFYDDFNAAAQALSRMLTAEALSHAQHTPLFSIRPRGSRAHLLKRHYRGAHACSSPVLPPHGAHLKMHARLSSSPSILSECPADGRMETEGRFERAAPSR